MGTTALTMLIVGPAILQPVRSDATRTCPSLRRRWTNCLPAWASYVGTLIGIAVLLSACAAAAQGIQNLMLGLALPPLRAGGDGTAK